MVREIPLTKGYVALIDEEDYARLAEVRWHADEFDHTTYASRKVLRDGKTIKVYLHRAVMDAPAGTEVDHANGDGLDCQRENLRYASSSQQNQNRRARRSDGLKGINHHPSSVRHPRVRCWQAVIKLGGKKKSLGYFLTKEEAARAYDAAAREHFGPFARPNYPQEA